MPPPPPDEAPPPPPDRRRRLRSECARRTIETDRDRTHERARPPSPSLCTPRALSAALDERRVDEHEVRRRDAEGVLEAVEPASRPSGRHVAPNLGDRRALRVADDAAAVVDEGDEFVLRVVVGAGHVTYPMLSERRGILLRVADGAVVLDVRDELARRARATAISRANRVDGGHRELRDVRAGDAAAEERDRLGAGAVELDAARAASDAASVRWVIA